MHGDTESLTPDIKTLVKAEMERINWTKVEDGKGGFVISLEEAIERGWRAVVLQEGAW